MGCLEGDLGGSKGFLAASKWSLGTSEVTLIAPKLEFLSFLQPLWCNLHVLPRPRLCGIGWGMSGRNLYSRPMRALGALQEQEQTIQEACRPTRRLADQQKSSKRGSLEDLRGCMGCLESVLGGSRGFLAASK